MEILLTAAPATNPAPRAASRADQDSGAPPTGRRGTARARRVLAAGTPAHMSRRIAVQAALSSEPNQDKAGTLYVNWLFEPGTLDELIEDIYVHTLPLAIFAAMQGAQRARVTWPQDDEIAARVMTAAAPPKGGVQ